MPVPLGRIRFHPHGARESRPPLDFRLILEEGVEGFPGRLGAGSSWGEGGGLSFDGLLGHEQAALVACPFSGNAFRDLLSAFQVGRGIEEHALTAAVEVGPALGTLGFQPDIV